MVWGTAHTAQCISPSRSPLGSALWSNCTAACHTLAVWFKRDNRNGVGAVGAAREGRHNRSVPPPVLSKVDLPATYPKVKGSLQVYYFAIDLKKHCRKFLGFIQRSSRRLLIGNANQYIERTIEVNSGIKNIPVGLKWVLLINGREKVTKWLYNNWPEYTIVPIPGQVILPHLV